MENWPNTLPLSMTRFCCKLMNTGQVKHYDVASYQTITYALLSIKPLISNYFNLSNYRLRCENGYILLNSNDKIHKKFSNNFAVITIIPDYMYSKPECIFYNSRGNSDRISYLIKQNAIKKIQHFYRSIFKKECPCCYEAFNHNIKYYKCNHCLCYNCFNDWNARGSTCPLCRMPVKQSYLNNTLQNSINNDNENLGYIWNILRASRMNSRYPTTPTTTGVTSNTDDIHNSIRRRRRYGITEAPTLYNNGERVEVSDESDEENMSPDNTPFSHLN